MSNNKIYSVLSQDEVFLEHGGEPVEMQLTVENRSETIKDYAITISGLEDAEDASYEWINFEKTRLVGLYPKGYSDQKTQENVNIRLSTPDAIPAGKYTLWFEVTNEDDKREKAVARCRLTVGAAYDFEIALKPEHQQGLSQADFDIQVSNRSTTAITVHLTISELDQVCEHALGDPALNMAVGETLSTKLVLTNNSLPGQGVVHEHKFTVKGHLSRDHQGIKRVKGVWRQQLPLLEMSIHPEEQRVSKNTVNWVVLLRNHSDDDVSVILRTSDDQDAGQYTTAEPMVLVPANGSCEVTVGASYPFKIERGFNMSISVLVTAYLATHDADVVAQSEAFVAFEGASIWKLMFVGFWIFLAVVFGGFVYFKWPIPGLLVFVFCLMLAWLTWRFWK